MKVMSGQKSVSSGAGGVAPAVVADVPVPNGGGSDVFGCGVGSCQ